MNLAQIREKLAKARAKRQAYADSIGAVLNRSEGQAPATPEELASADSQLAEAEALSAEIVDLERQEREASRAERLAALTAPAAGGRGGPLPGTLPANLPPGRNDRVPAVPHSGGRLRAFSNDEAGQRLAFAFGAAVYGLTALPGAQHCREVAASLGVELGRFGRQLAGFGETESLGGEGYLMPPTVSALVDRLRLQYGVARSAAEFEPLDESDQSEAPVLAGGVTAFPTKDGQTRAAQTLAFKQATVTGRSWSAMVPIPKSYSPAKLAAIGDKVVSEIAIAFALTEDYAFFVGDGTEAYQGAVGLLTRLLQAEFAGSLAACAVGNNALEKVTTGDWATAAAKLPKFVGIQPAWYMHGSVYEIAMAPLIQAVGFQSPAEAPVPQYRGYPVVFTNALPEASTVTAGKPFALLGDLRRSSKFGAKTNTRIETDASVFFASDQIAVKGETVFGHSHHTLGNQETAGPVIALKLAA